MTDDERNEWHSLSKGQLREAIERQVDLVDSDIELGGVKLNWLRVANPDVLLEQAVEGDADKSEAEIDPFWAATWRAALGLDSFLGRLKLDSVPVLELGCGSGQAGTGAAIRCANVTATDSVVLALQVAKLNAWSYLENISFRPLVWSEQNLGQRFPIIIGSDLVYDPNLFEYLERCAREHLADDGRMFLSEPHRHSGDKFSKWIREKGWSTTEHDVDLNDDRIPVRVFECALG